MFLKEVVSFEITPPQRENHHRKVYLIMINKGA